MNGYLVASTLAFLTPNSDSGPEVSRSRGGISVHRGCQVSTKWESGSTIKIADLATGSDKSATERASVSISNNAWRLLSANDSNKNRYDVVMHSSDEQVLVNPDVHDHGVTFKMNFDRLSKLSVSKVVVSKDSQEFAVFNWQSFADAIRDLQKCMTSQSYSPNK